MKSLFSGSKYTAAAAGTVVSIILYFAFASLFALLIYVFDIDRKYIPFLSTLSLSLACFAGSYITARAAGDKGYAIGGAIGVICFAAVTAVSAFVSGGRFTLNTLFHFLLIVLSAVIGGILGVNGKNRKII